MSAEKVKGEIQRLNKEIATLRQSPDAPQAWKEMLKVELQLDQLKQQRFKEQQPLNARLHELRESRDVQNWEDRLSKLEGRLK
jgi:hypothetical protein